MTDFNLIKMYIIFIALVIFFILAFKKLRIQYKDVKKYTWLILLLIFVLTLGIRLSIPHYYKLYMDEPRYVEVANNIVLYNTAQIQKYYGTDYQFFEPFHPIGWPFLISIAFRFFGSSGTVAAYANTIISSFTVFFVFLIGYLLFKKEHIALWAAFLFALNPLHIYWSTSAGVNAPSLFFMLLSLIAFITYCRTKNIWLHLLGTFCFLYSTLMRLEYVLLLSIIVLVYILFFKNIKSELKKIAFWIPWLAILLFYGVYYSAMVLFLNKLRLNVGAALVSETGSFSATGIMSNLSQLVEYLMSTYGLMLVLFMLIGIYILFKRDKRLLLLVLGWLVVFSSFYLSYYRFQIRHMLFPLVALYFLIAFGISYVLTLKQVKRYKILLTAVVSIVIVLFQVPHILPLYHVEDNLMLQTKIPELIEASADSECYFVTARPAILSSSTNLKVIPLDYFIENPSAFTNLKGSNACVMFYYSSYQSQEQFEVLKQNYVLDKHTRFELGSKQYNLYNISKI